jgi:hypothetical protein
VQQARGHFLARSGRPGDQQAAAGVGHALERGAHLVDRGGIAGELFRSDKALAQALVLATQALGFGRAFDQQQQALGLERLFQKSMAPRLIAETAVSMLPWPEKMITGSSGSRFLISSSTSRPSIGLPWSQTSSSTRLGRRSSTAARAEVLSAARRQP